MIVGRKEKALGVYKKRSLISINYAIAQIKQSKIAPFVQDLYLYGSCARNEQDYDSDVDLLLELWIFQILFYLQPNLSHQRSFSASIASNKNCQPRFKLHVFLFV